MLVLNYSPICVITKISLCRRQNLNINRRNVLVYAGNVDIFLKITLVAFGSLLKRKDLTIIFLEQPVLIKALLHVNVILFNYSYLIFLPLTLLNC